MSLVNLTLFLITFLCIANWVPIWILLRDFIKRRKFVTSSADKNLIEYLKKKTNLNFSLKLIESGSLFGMTSRFFFTKPIIVISTQVIEFFTRSELEWMLLHEAGHIVLRHQLQMALLQGSINLMGGLFMIATSPERWFPFKTVVFGIAMASLYFQFNRRLELAADYFAVKRMEDPHGMITANEKMKNKVKSIFYKNKVLGLLFTPHPTYDKRIKIAQAELLKRNRVA